MIVIIIMTILTIRIVITITGRGFGVSSGFFEMLGVRASGSLLIQSLLDFLEFLGFGV